MSEPESPTAATAVESASHGQIPDADTLERIFHAAVARGDAKGVDISLRFMVVRDPRRAARLYDSLRLALAVRGVSGLLRAALVPCPGCAESRCPACDPIRPQDCSPVEGSDG